MKRFMLIVFIGLELSYYLLIVQTGLVEYLGSDLLRIAPLPIGGVIGSLIVHFTDIQNKNKISFFIAMQLLISFFYPHFSFVMLFFLGLCAGALAPLMIYELKKARAIDIGLALGLSYTFGTALFNYDVANRAWIAIALSVVILLTSRFLPLKGEKFHHNKQLSLLIMVAWIFLDSALFETLSRDVLIPIWRLNLTAEIIFFHLLGIFLALYIKAPHSHKIIATFVLFGISYVLYFIQEPLLLAAVYPVVISYYNVLILQTLLQKELKTIGIFMVFIAWIASGAGLVVALHGLSIIMPIIVIFFLLRYTNKIKQKDIQCLKYSS